MGKCNFKPRTAPPRSQVVGGCPIPDVSEYQPHINWREARSHICGTVLRVGDGHFRDTVFQRYLREVRALHIYHAIYLYLRPWYPTCAGEADYALAAIPGGLDSGPLIGDGETALNPGCFGQFGAEVERRTGWRITVDYSSEGTYPGGARSKDKQWDAAYGPFPGCFFQPCYRVAWQHTDGEIGPYPHSIPGIGPSDISRDEGLSSIRQFHPPPVNHTALEARIRAIHRWLVQYGCRRRERNHERLGPRCRAKAAEGRRDIALLKGV